MYFLEELLILEFMKVVIFIIGGFLEICWKLMGVLKF